MMIRMKITLLIMMTAALAMRNLAATRDDFADRMAMLPGLAAQLTSLPEPEQDFLEHLIFYTTSVVTSANTPPSILIKQLSVLECLLDDHFFNPRTPEADGEVLLDMLDILAGLELDTILELPVAEPVDPVEPEPEDCTVSIQTLVNETRFEATSDRRILLTGLSEIVHLHATASEEGTFTWMLGPLPSLAERFRLITSEDGRAVSVMLSDSFYRQARNMPQFRTGVLVTVKFTSASDPDRMCEDQIAINLQYRNAGQ